MCVHTHPHTHPMLASLFQWDVFLQDTTKFTLLICILLYPLIPCVVFYCWSVLCSCLWCIFSKCSTSDLSLVNHLVDSWLYLPFFKSIRKSDPVLWRAASFSQYCIICWFYNHTAFESLGLLWKYQIETDLNRWDWDAFERYTWFDRALENFFSRTTALWFQSFLCPADGDYVWTVFRYIGNNNAEHV